VSDNIAIKAQNISKTFHEQAGARSFKSAFVNAGNSLKGKGEKKINKGDFTALKDINFEIKKGEFFGIVGRNGSGKSTLLKILAGVYTPTTGAVTVNGNLTPFIELGVGFNPELSGRDNVYLNGALLGFNRKQMDEMYDDIVEFAELKDFMDTKLKNYSSGMQVRLAFSVAIRAESDILLIDEVLAVGDAAFQQKCFNYFEKLKKNRQTVIFVTHDMESVRRFCNRALYLEKGVLKDIGKTTKIADMYIAKNINIEVKPKEKRISSSLEINIIDRTKERIVFDINSLVKYDFEVYSGFSILLNGISVAELNNSSNIKKNRYNLSTKNLNPGIYEISAGLFKLENRELISIVDSRKTFQIKGHDRCRGGALRLEDNWTDD